MGQTDACGYYQVMIRYISLTLIVAASFFSVLAPLDYAHLRTIAISHALVLLHYD